MLNKDGKCQKDFLSTELKFYYLMNIQIAEAKSHACLNIYIYLVIIPHTTWYSIVTVLYQLMYSI